MNDDDLNLFCRQLRREFHRFPEAGWLEYRSSARIAEILREIGCKDILCGEKVLDPSTVPEELAVPASSIEAAKKQALEQGAAPEWLHQCADNPGIIALFQTGRPGPCIAFRFDIDALPYGEICSENDFAEKKQYMSRNPDAVHACAHDSHIAIGLGLARRITQNKESLSGRIKLIFQPAEELYGGAQSIVNKGHLDDVDYFLAIHAGIGKLGKAMNASTLCCGCDDFLAAGQYDVRFKGVSAHPCGAAEKGKNALLAACSAALSLHGIAPHGDGKVRVNVGQIQAGTCANTIADHAMIRVEFRGETDEIFAYVKRRVGEIIDGAAHAYDLSYAILDYGSIETAKSDRPLMRQVRQAAALLGKHQQIFQSGNIQGSDDASIMMRRVQRNGGQASYIGFGIDRSEDLHHPAFDFRDGNLGDVADLLFQTIIQLQEAAE